uniref:Uncharacterized protein n=1 Tax=Siphoviridae sp. ctBLh2 TaxID=2827803 RepID=A0A8S5S3L0_9CAUD|nr:MAG TPA: hypothetical protein [Siphoviridae sp. ctBLh2]
MTADGRRAKADAPRGASAFFVPVRREKEVKSAPEFGFSVFSYYLCLLFP